MKGRAAIRPILIVGQGLAGTLLSMELGQRGVLHNVLDNGHRFSSTAAAAGIINPVTGRHYVKSWMIDTLLPMAIDTYKKLEVYLQTTLVHQRNIIRSLNTPANENHWMARTADPIYAPYIKHPAEPGAWVNVVRSQRRFGEITGSYQVDIAHLIKRYRSVLEGQGILVEDDFDYTQLTVNEHECSYKGCVYELVVFCEGYRAVLNPFFKYLPFQPVKGEALLLKIGDFHEQKILRDDIFLVPMNAGSLFWSGGGYDKTIRDHLPSAVFYEQWQEKIRQTINSPFEIHDHKAGIRPSTKDRRPFLGRHPRYKNLYIFNGLGTKGASLGPYFARKMATYLISGIIPGKEVHISRFN